jgi:uncharacterized membrane protein YtjA (UPF0391 family)
MRQAPFLVALFTPKPQPCAILQLISLFWTLRRHPCTILQLISLFWTLRRHPCAILQLISLFWTLRRHPCTVLQLISIFWTLRSRFLKKERGYLQSRYFLAVLRQPLSGFTWSINQDYFIRRTLRQKVCAPL